MEATIDITRKIPTQIIQLISSEQAWQFRMIPIDRKENDLVLGVDQTDWSSDKKETLEVLLGLAIEVELIASETITRLLGQYYRRDQNNVQQIQVQVNKADHFLNDLIAEAHGLGSSDIHIESLEHAARVRIRIDGQLIEKYRIEKLDMPALINKVKVKARLDISEKRLPQDGRIHFNEHGLHFDIRVSVLPTLNGEKIVLRILNNDASHIEIDFLGFTQRQKADYLQGIRQPSGILLISGPTGSGKTTTLYATLKQLNEEKRNILTIEDPVEYTLEGINQVQLKENIGLTFASTLRSFLRQDPDVIMVGEIRDKETAEIAIRAALTGHLVLSTIHTNSAWGTVARLIDMGVAPYLLSGTLNTTVAQRLVRKLCPICKSEVPFNPKQLPVGYLPHSTITHVAEPVGCDACFYTGYKGRQALYEVIGIDHDLAGFIRQNKNLDSDMLKVRHLDSLADSAWNALAHGISSIEELFSLFLNQR